MKFQCAFSYKIQEWLIYGKLKWTFWYQMKTYKDRFGILRVSKFLDL